MVVIRPFGVLLIIGRLVGDGCNEEGSRVCEIVEFVRSWKWGCFIHYICTHSTETSETTTTYIRSTVNHYSPRSTVRGTYCDI